MHELSGQRRQCMKAWIPSGSEIFPRSAQVAVGPVAMKGLHVRSNRGPIHGKFFKIPRFERRPRRPGAVAYVTSHGNTPISGGGLAARPWKMFPSVRKESNPMKAFQSLFAWLTEDVRGPRSRPAQGRRAPACESLEGRRLLSAGMSPENWTTWGRTPGSPAADVHHLGPRGTIPRG